MTGLLGQGWEDPKSAAIMALAGGLLQGNMGAGLLGANQAYGNSQNDAVKRQLVQAQLQETLAQAEERKQKMELARRQQEMQNGLLYGGGSAPSGPATQSMGAGFMQPGGEAGGLIGQARQLGIPEHAIQADLAFNGGKGIAEMLFKRGAPDMQVTNGYAFDKNRLGPGFMPQLSTSQDGKTSMVRIGPDGLPVVSAPQGALNTFAGYENVREGTKANYDLQTVTPAGQQPQMTTRGALATNPQVQGRMVPPAQQAAMDRDRQGILTQELRKAEAQLQAALRSGDQSAASRAQGDIAALNRELGGRSATVGMPLQSEEDKLRSQKGVEGDARTNEARAKDIATAKKFLSIAQQAEEALKSGPTASGAGALADKTASFFGVSTKGAEAASRLKGIGGWLVANVPRMEGPQSNFDVGNYQVMAADVANETLPVERRMAALQTIKQMMQNTVDGGPAGDFGPKEPSRPMLNELPKNAPKGQRVRDTQTGKILQFNGFSWVEAK